MNSIFRTRVVQLGSSHANSKSPSQGVLLKQYKETPTRTPMVKHNNQIPKGHFHKDWQSYVRTWFDQPAKKHKRRDRRTKRAKKIFPRPMVGVRVVRERERVCVCLYEMCVYVCYV